LTAQACEFTPTPPQRPPPAAKILATPMNCGTHGRDVLSEQISAELLVHGLMGGRSAVVEIKVKVKVNVDLYSASS